MHVRRLAMPKSKRPPKAPFPRGARLRNGEKVFKVSKCEAYECHTCHGEGRLWKITLRGNYGLFETTLDAVQKSGYIRVERKKKEETT